MKSTAKTNSSQRKSAFPRVKFNEAFFKSEEINKAFKVHTDEDINYQNKKGNIKNGFGIELQNTELNKKNVFKKAERINCFTKLKYKIKRKLYSLYYDSRLNYNKLVINNILSNSPSRIKVIYTEMLNEIETIDLFCKYIYRRDVYYFLKYLVVVYDKNHMQYPNYLKNINVYNFMSKYLLQKQKFIDRASESNYHTYIHENIKKYFSNDISLDSRFFQSKMSQDNSEEENYVKIHQIRDQGFEVDDENSQDSLDKLQNLVLKISKSTVKKDKGKEYKRARSKSIKTIDTFLVKYINTEKNKRVKLTNLFSINNKKFLRSQKKKKTEIVSDRKKKTMIINMKRTDMNNTRKKNSQRKMTRKQNITEMKKLVLLNDIGKNSRVLDIMKRGFLFINDDKKINNNKAQKNLIKIKENNKEKHNSLSIKRIDNKSINFNYSNDFYKGDNFLLFKNIKTIIKSLNDNLNDYQFYNRIPFNSSEKEKFYNRKVIKGIFNKNSNLILNFRKNKLKNEKRKEFPSIGTNTSSRQTFNTSADPRCKKFEKLNKNIIIKKKIKKNKNSLILPNYAHKKKSKYNIYCIKTDTSEENPRLFRNQIERLENSIYSFNMANNTKNKKVFHSTLNDFNKVSGIDLNNSKDTMNKNIKRNNLFITNSGNKYNIISKRKFEFFIKNDKKIFNNTSYNTNQTENIEVNKQNAFSMRNSKNINKNELNHISFNSSKYNFKLKNEKKNTHNDFLRPKNKKTVIKIKH